MSKYTNLAIIVIAYSVITIALFAAMQLNWLSVLEPLALSIFHFSSSTFPALLAALVCLALMHSIQSIYKGNYIWTISNVLKFSALSFFGYFLASNIPGFQTVSLLGFYVLISVLIVIAYSGFTRILKASKQITLYTLTRITLLVSLAIVSSLIVLYISPDNTLVASMPFSGFLFAAFTTSFYPANFSEKPKTKRLGKLMNRDLISIIVIGAVIALFIGYIHPILYAQDQNLTLIGEWLSIGMVVLICYLYIRTKVEGITIPVMVETWGKHQQELDFKTTEAMTDLTQKIEEFITFGNKNRILLYLINFMFEKKIDFQEINYTLDALINYKDLSPKIYFRWDEKMISNLNKENRTKILSGTIKRIEEFYLQKIEVQKGAI